MHVYSEKLNGLLIKVVIFVTVILISGNAIVNKIFISIFSDTEISLACVTNEDEVSRLKAEIARLQGELFQTEKSNAKWEQRCKDLEAELVEVKAEKNELKKLVEEKEIEKVEPKVVDLNEDEEKEAIKELEKANSQISKLTKELDDMMRNASWYDEYASQVREDNVALQHELDEITHVLHRRDAELDDLHGRLMASRYYINYLQNRPEFQNIRKDEYLPPDMRRKSSKAKIKKRVRFADELGRRSHFYSRLII